MSAVEAPPRERVRSTSHRGREPRLLLPGLLGLFFLSGASALVYQQLWARLLSLVFGVTVYAVATVLASFFAGLALGSLLAGRIVDLTGRPLRWYGVVEILVGAAALATPATLAGVERVYVGIVGAVPDSVALLTVIRLVLSFAVFVIPATLMGASLPIVVKSSVLRSTRLGARVSLLYATNTAGAIAGTLVAGFWLIGAIGLGSSFRLAAGVNFAVGTVALLWSRRIEPKPTGDRPAAATAPATVAPDEQVPHQVRRTVIVVFGISGFVALALEIVWFRVLALYLVSTTYAFTIVLATVLFGISAGSYLVAPLLRRRYDWLKILAATELVLAVVTLVSLEVLARGYGLVDQATLAGDGTRATLAVSGLAILPTTVIMGMAFPIGMVLWVGGHPDQAGRRVGVFYSVNVAGGILGSLVAGFVLLPALGARASLVVLAALLLGCGVALALALAEPRARRAFVATGTTVFVLAGAVAVPDPYASVLEHRYPGERVLWQQEGIQTTVSIHERPDGVRVMYLDGLDQANDGPAMVAYHGLIGTLPMAVHPDPKRALVVGLGGGVTAGAVSTYAGVEVDVVELSREVVHGAEWFAEVNQRVVDQPNVRIRVDDGRNHLLVTDRRYDVITADLIQPFHAGAGKLWSVEYWELARDALTDGGIVLQWIPADHDPDYRLIMRSFLEVFPNATLWAEGTMLVGSRERLQLDRATFDRKLLDPETRGALAAHGITSFESLLGLYTAGPHEMGEFVGGGPLLIDDRPRIEFFRGLDRDDAPNLTGLRGDVADITGP